MAQIEIRGEDKRFFGPGSDGGIDELRDKTGKSDITKHQSTLKRVDNDVMQMSPAKVDMSLSATGDNIPMDTSAKT